jgi:hypothetical protein
VLCDDNKNRSKEEDLRDIRLKLEEGYVVEGGGAFMESIFQWGMFSKI